MFVMVVLALAARLLVLPPPSLAQAAGFAASSVPVPSFTDHVLLLTNQARQENGLPPLKANERLAAAAQAHAQAMADGDFFDHLNPQTGTEVDQRLNDAGYVWSTVGENIAAGNTTPAMVVPGWMESPGHRQNILNPDFRELGVGYVLDAEDKFPAGTPYSHYWVQVFAAQRNVFPLIIANESLVVDAPQVALYLYGNGWAQEMRLRNDDEPFGTWQPFAATLNWDLPATFGEHRVEAELRQGDQIVTAADTVFLNLPGAGVTASTETSASSLPAASAATTPITSTLPVLAEPEPNSLQIAAQLDPATLSPDQEATVTLSLQGTLSPLCQGIPGKAVEAVFVFDVSDSAGNGAPGSNWYATAQFIHELFAALAQPVYSDISAPPQRSHLALVSSLAGVAGPEANVLLPLTDDVSQAALLLDNITPGGDSNIADGLRKAGELLAAGDPARHHLIFLMLHDNIPLSPAALEAAQQVRTAGIQIYLVSNDLNIATADQITPALAQSITQDGAHFLANPQTGDLRRILVTASGGTLRAAGQSVRIRSNLTPDNAFDIVDVGDAGVIRAGEVLWEIAQIEGDEQRQLHYRIKAHADAPLGAMQLLLGTSYLDCNGYLQGGDWATGASLQPAPLATPLTLVAAATPTPIPTRPPTVVAPTLPPPLLPISSSAPITQPLFPTQSLSQTLCPDQAVTYPLLVPIPAHPLRADVLLAFDVSGSMGDVLASAAANGAVVVEKLRQLIPDVQIGITIFSDYPTPPYGDPGDTPYDLLQSVTSNSTTLDRVFASLPGQLQSGGSSSEESYSRLLYEAAENSAIGWRPDARHFVIVFGDEINHDVDPGRDGIPGTSDDLRLPDVLDELASEQVTPLFALSNADAVAHWQPYSAPLGGEALLMEDAGRLATIIADLIDRSGAKINRLTLEASSGYTAWLQNASGELHNLTVGDGLQQPMEAIIHAPPGIYAGTYTLGITAVGDGATYGRWMVLVTVPTSCAPPPPPPPAPPPPFPCDAWWWLWLIPLLLPLLAFLLWWLVRTLINRRRRYPPPASLRCWLPCLLALLWLLLLSFIIGQRLARAACIAWQTSSDSAVSAGGTSSGATSVMTNTIGATGSQQVAAIIASGDFELSSPRPEVAFTPIALDDLNTAMLDQYDTVLLSQVCNIADQPRDRLYSLIDWVGRGHKLILYDSDECSNAVDYTWLPYPFTTNNPGALGSTNGSLQIVADDSLVASTPGHLAYIDPTNFAEIEIGDANVIVTQDLRWCGNIEGVNDNGTRGYVHGYSLYQRGLLIYNGLDVDNISAPGPYQLWQHELEQPWDAVNGQPQGLTCTHRVAGTVALWAPLLLWGIPIPLRLALLPLLLLWLLCWLGCRRKVTVEPLPPAPIRLPLPLQPAPPPEPLDAWSGPPPVWSPEKTLIIGLGGTGRWTLTLIKKNLLDAGAGTYSPNVRLLLLDTTEEERIGDISSEVSFAGVQLSQEEILPVGADLNQLIREMANNQPTADPNLASWLPLGYYAQRREAELNLKRSTGGERPLGRATLFHDLRQSDASRVWHALLDGMQAIREEEAARVILVGSLAGGFGGAALSDVAYLVRHAARKVGARFAAIEAYLACQNTFNAVVNLNAQRQLAANTFAALQELRRFQLQGNSFPYHICYSRQYPNDPVWNGVLDRPLIDDLYLFDGYRPQRPLQMEQPVHGVLATIADSVTLHLDQASRNGPASLWNYRRQMQGLATTIGQETGQAVVGTLGSFAYRLPVYDINEALKVRWVKHLLSYFLVGDQNEPLRIDARLNREQLTAQSPRQFVRGTAALGKPAPAIVALGNLNQRGPALPETPTIQQWGDWIATIRLSDLEREQRFYAEYLADGLHRLLNGFATDDLLVARAGKVGYALRWLEELEEEWQHIGSHLDLTAHQLGEQRPADWEQWRQLPERYRQSTAQLRKQVQETATQISRQLMPGATEGWREAQAAPQALYEHLLQRDDQLKRQRDQLRAIRTRRYFVKDDLLDRWYSQYLAEKVSDHVGRLYWVAQADGSGIDLAFNGLGGKTQLLRDGIPAMLKALLDVAGFLAREIWITETLAAYLSASDLHPSRVLATAEEMWIASAPLLDFDAGVAAQVQAQTVLGVNQSVTNSEPLQAHFALKLPMRQQMRSLAITDPYTMILARFYDAIPAHATRPYQEAEQQYRGLSGLTPETAGKAGFTAPRTVFAAERNALIYQQRLGELNQSPRLFHPLLVTALEDRERALLFIQALCSGLVHPDYYGEREQWVVETQNAPFPLTRGQADTFANLSPTLIAMLRFVVAPERVLREVEKLLVSITDRQERWLAYVRSDLSNLYHSRHPGDGDLASVIDLVLYDLTHQQSGGSQ